MYYNHYTANHLKKLKAHITQNSIKWSLYVLFEKSIIDQIFREWMFEKNKESPWKCTSKVLEKSLNKRPKGPLSLTWVQSTLQKFDFGMEPKTTTLHPTCFKITAMHSVCCYNLLGWRSFWNVPPSLMDWPGWQFLFTFRPVKQKLGRGRWELAFC